MTVVLVRGVHGNFRRRQAEDQPPAAHVDVREPEHVAEEHAVRVWILAVDDGVRTCDHRQPP
jgi:hypothetical protein